MRHIAYATLVVVAALLGAAGADAAALGVERELTLSPTPLWVVSAAWGPDGDLLVVDALSRQVVRYPIDGGRGEEVDAWRQVSVKAPRPSAVVVAGGRYAIEADTAHLAYLNDRLGFAGELDVATATRGPRGEVATLYDWTLTGEHVIAFSDVKLATAASGQPEWTSGFVKIPLAAPREFEILRRVGLDDPERGYYLLGLRLLTSVGGDAYLLSMGRTPHLGRVAADGGAGLALSVPAVLDDAVVPALEPTDGFRKESVVDLFRRLEQASIPAGLYGWGGSLWLLGRTPAGDGGTRWTVTRVDPASGESGGTFVLPTTAPHVTVVPGDPYWAIIEKGHVEGFGKQDVLGALLVSGAALAR
jgi:hypothetical protein